MFERDRVTLNHPDRTIVQTEGFWGGVFSSRQDTDGSPRLVVGFNGVSFVESDGSEGEFFGSFLGLSGPFGETGESGPLPGDGNCPFGMLLLKCKRRLQRVTLVEADFPSAAPDYCICKPNFCHMDCTPCPASTKEQ